MSTATEFPKVTAEQAAGMERTPDGLTVAHVWVYIGGCPVWRGYDPPEGSVHDLGELAFGEQCRARGLEWDRCQCGGLSAWDDSEEAWAAARAKDGPQGIPPGQAHYPASFVAELHGEAP